MMMYLFFPHVKVKTVPALCGAVFASIFWFIVQRAYILLQIGVAKYNAIYGSFATVPLLLIWMQLGWTFILLGAVLAYAIQNRDLYQLPETGNKPQQALQRAFDVLLTVYSSFNQGRPVNTEQLASRMAGKNKGSLDRTVDLLVEGELLLKSEINGTERLAPARPAALLCAEDVVHLVLADDKLNNGPGATLARQVIKAAEQAVGPEEFPAHVETLPDIGAEVAQDSPV
jgi:membrane protein